MYHHVYIQFKCHHFEQLLNHQVLQRIENLDSRLTSSDLFAFKASKAKFARSFAFRNIPQIAILSPLTSFKTAREHHNSFIVSINNASKDVFLPLSYFEVHFYISDCIIPSALKWNHPCVVIFDITCRIFIPFHCT